MKVVPFSKEETYVVEEKQKEDLTGIIPEWTDLIDIIYNPFTGGVNEICVRRNFNDKKVQNEYIEKLETYKRRRKDAKNDEERFEISREQIEFEQNYTKSIKESSQIEKILELIEKNKWLGESATRTLLRNNLL